MNPNYLWLTGAMELLAFFVAGPLIAAAIAYSAWRRRSHDSTPHLYVVTACVASGVTATLLFAFAKWMNADVRTSQYFLQLASVLLSGLFFGVFMGCGFSVLLRIWRWQETTRLSDESQAEQ